MKYNKKSPIDERLRKQLDIFDLVLRNNRLYREKKEKSYNDTIRMLNLMNKKEKEEGFS